jgi:hypothetical protein
MKTKYAAHLIMAVRFDTPRPGPIPFYENVVLIYADSDDDALRKACRIGRDEAAVEENDFRWGGRPARWEFAGVRKLIACRGPAGSGTDRIGHGAEVTYSEMAVRSEADLKKLVTGEPVEVMYNE